MDTFFPTVGKIQKGARNCLQIGFSADLIIIPERIIKVFFTEVLISESVDKIKKK